MIYVDLTSNSGPNSLSYPNVGYKVKLCNVPDTASLLTNAIYPTYTFRHVDIAASHNLRNLHRDKTLNTEIRKQMRRSTDCSLMQREHALISVEQQQCNKRTSRIYLDSQMSQGE